MELIWFHIGLRFVKISLTGPPCTRWPGEIYALEYSSTVHTVTKTVQIRISYDIFAEYIPFRTFHCSKKVRIRINSAKVLNEILILRQKDTFGEGNEQQVSLGIYILSDLKLKISLL